MAFLKSSMSARARPIVPPLPSAEPRRGGWPAPVGPVPRCHWERNGDGRIVRRWVLENSSQRADPLH
jgi:hypothetical protein